MHLLWETVVQPLKDLNTEFSPDSAAPHTHPLQEKWKHEKTAQTCSVALSRTADSGKQPDCLPREERTHKAGISTEQNITGQYKLIKL